jgi:hypothetical protein
LAVRIFHNKAFARFAKKAGIDDAVLCQAISEAERGLASELLAYDDKTLARVVASGTLTEVTCGEQTIQ